MKLHAACLAILAHLPLPALAETLKVHITSDKVEACIGTLECKDGAPTSVTTANVLGTQDFT